jgi:uncharacterized protein YecE (DUF72 family)
MADKRGKIRIGCSGWNYKHWRGRFYPEEEPPSRWFEFYAATFDTVEINNTFYQLPEARTFKSWRAQAPKGFIYAVKANRYLTHLKKLKDAKAPLRKFLDRARLLQDGLGPILYQLPPRWRSDPERLKSFLDLLPGDIGSVIEFRDQSWLVDEVFQLLEDRGVSFCAHDLPGLDTPRLAIGKLAYVRFHGAGRKYGGGYPEPTLRSWGRWIEKQSRAGKDVYVYFNNDAEAHAVRDALRLKRKLNQFDFDNGFPWRGF